MESSREKAPHRPASWLCLPCRCKGGDIITGLNGKTTQGLSPEDALNQMRCRPNSNVTLTIKSQKALPLEIAMRRDVIHIQVAKQRMEPGNIGYVRLTEFTEQADTAVRSRATAAGSMAATDDRWACSVAARPRASAGTSRYAETGRTRPGAAPSRPRSRWSRPSRSRSTCTDSGDQAGRRPAPVRSLLERCRIVTAQCLWVRAVSAKAPCRL